MSNYCLNLTLGLNQAQKWLELMNKNIDSGDIQTSLKFIEKLDYFLPRFENITDLMIGKIVSSKFGGASDLGSFQTRKGITLFTDIGGRSMLLDAKGEIIVNPTEIQESGNNGYIIQDDLDKKYYFADCKGNRLTENYKSINPFSNGFALVSEADGWRFFINQQYQIAFKKTGYKDAIPFKNGIAATKRIIEGWSLIDIHGNPILKDRSFTWVGEFSEGLLPVQENSEFDSMAYINLDGEAKIDFRRVPNKPRIHDARGFHDGHAAIFCSFPDQNGNYPAQNKAWSFVDKEGKFINEARYISVEDFHDGMARVQEEPGDYYYIDTEGKKLFGGQVFNFSEEPDEYGFILTKEANNFVCLDLQGNRYSFDEIEQKRKAAAAKKLDIKELIKETENHK